MELNSVLKARLENEVNRLRQQGKDAQVKTILEALDYLQRNDPVQAAMILLAAERRLSSKDAITFCLLAADLFYSKRGFQLAIMALGSAGKYYIELGEHEKVVEIEDRVEKIRSEIPHNFEECFSELERQLTLVQLQDMRQQTEADMIKYHSNLGMWLRNSWGLWSDSHLAEYMRDKGFRHPDDMSMKILTEFNRYLRNKSETKQ